MPTITNDAFMVSGEWADARLQYMSHDGQNYSNYKCIDTDTDM